MTQEVVFTKASALTVEFKLRKPLSVPSKAVLMVKRDLSDDDAEAVIAKVIYQAANAHGVIADPTGNPLLRFLVNELDTQALEVDGRYFTCLKVWPTGGAPYSPTAARKAVRVLSAGVFTTT